MPLPYTCTHSVTKVKGCVPEAVISPVHIHDLVRDTPQLYPSRKEIVNEGIWESILTLLGKLNCCYHSPIQFFHDLPCYGIRVQYISVKYIMYCDFTGPLPQSLSNLSSIIGLVVLGRKMANGNCDQVCWLRASCIQDLQNLAIDREFRLADHFEMCRASSCDIHSVKPLIPFPQLLGECNLNCIGT